MRGTYCRLMQVKQIEVSYTRKKQVEEYEPRTVSESLTVSLDEDEDPDDVRDEIHQQVRDSVDGEILNIMVENGKGN